MMGCGDRLEEEVQLDLCLLRFQFCLWLLQFGIGCGKWESIVLHLRLDAGKGDWEIRLVVTPAIQCSVGCCCCCGTQGQTSSWIWMEQIGNKSSAVWAGLSLNGHCGVDCCPSHKDLQPRSGAVITCHSWAWTLVPPSHLEKGPVLGFKPRGAVLLVGTHGRNVRLFQTEQLTLLPVIVSPAPMSLKGCRSIMNGDNRNVVCQSACRLSSQWLQGAVA